MPPLTFTNVAIGAGLLVGIVTLYLMLRDDAKQPAASGKPTIRVGSALMKRCPCKLGTRKGRRFA